MNPSSGPRPEATFGEQLARLLEARGWRLKNMGVRCWQDPLIPDGELVGIVAAIHRELRRDDDPHAEIDRAIRRERIREQLRATG